MEKLISDEELSFMLMKRRNETEKLSKLKDNLADWKKEWEDLRLKRGFKEMDSKHICTIECLNKENNRIIEINRKKKVYGCLDSGFLHFCNPKYSNCPWPKIEKDGLLYCLFSNRELGNFLCYEEGYEKYEDNPSAACSNMRKRKLDKDLEYNYYERSEKKTEISFSKGFGVLSLTDHYVGWIEKDIFKEIEIPCEDFVEQVILQKSKEEKLKNENKENKVVKKNKKKRKRRRKIIRVIPEKEELDPKIDSGEENGISKLKIEEYGLGMNIYPFVPKVIETNRKIHNRRVKIHSSVRKILYDLIWDKARVGRVEKYFTEKKKMEFEVEIKEYIKICHSKRGMENKWILKPRLDRLRSIRNKHIKLGNIGGPEYSVPTETIINGKLNNFYATLISCFRVLFLEISSEESLYEKPIFVKKKCSDFRFILGFIYMCQETGVIKEGEIIVPKDENLCLPSIDKLEELFNPLENIEDKKKGRNRNKKFHDENRFDSKRKNRNRNNYKSKMENYSIPSILLGTSYIHEFLSLADENVISLLKTIVNSITKHFLLS